MSRILKEGDSGPKIIELQKLLISREETLKPTGIFDKETLSSVYNFQSKHLDKNNQPLKPDGEVGDLTWWSLQYLPKFTIEPPMGAGGSHIGRMALKSAIAELNAGACEIEGNNSGPFVEKYLSPGGSHAGNGMESSWCAGFTSWCFLQAVDGNHKKMPFVYNNMARGIMNQFKKKGWFYDVGSIYTPVPGDIMMWWRDQPTAILGHVGIVYLSQNGYVFTIEGNKTSKVQGFSYEIGNISQLIGFGHVPEVV